MKAFRKRLAALLCAALCICMACAVAGDTADDTAEREARYERLLRFATEEYTAWWNEDYEDESESIPTSAYVRGEKYAEEKPDAPYDYSRLESLTLRDFNQAQFEHILARVPTLIRLALDGCTVEDYSPLLQIAPQLTLSLEWRPGLLERLAVLPNLQGLELYSIPDADLSPLAALTGLENLVLWFDSDSAVDLFPLGALPELCSLTLYSQEVPVETLPDMPALKALDISCAVDLAQLAHTPALERLYIGYAMTGDFTALQTLPALNYLKINAHDIDATDYVEELEALHEAMPGLEIVFYYCC